MKGQRETIVALAHHGYNVGSTWVNLNPMDYRPQTYGLLYLVH